MVNNMKLIVKNFSCHCACSSYNIKEFFSACNDFSYNFEGKAYLLCGNIDCGAWAFVNSISSHCKKKIFGINSKVVLNEEILSLKKLKNICCYIHRNMPNIFLKTTFKNALEKTIKQYKYPETYHQLFDLFEIPKHLHNKPICELGIYFPCYLAIIGLIKGYKIFATTWQGEFGFENHIIDKIAYALTAKNLIFFVPTDANNTYNYPYIKINMVDLFDDYRISTKYRGNKQ